MNLHKITTQCIAFTSMESIRLIASPISLISILFLIAFSGLPFLFPTSAGSHVFSFTSFASKIPLVCIVIIPIMGINTWHFERKNDMYSMILSLPVHESIIILSKFISRFFIYMLFLFSTILIAVISDSSLGMLVNTYLALLLFGAFSFALTIFFATLFYSTTVALLFSVLFLFVGMTIHFIPLYFVIPYEVSQILIFLSLSTHIESFLRGILDSRDIMYFLLPSIILLMASSFVIKNSRKKL